MTLLNNRQSGAKEAVDYVILH